jgi:hypothetical protein
MQMSNFWTCSSWRIARLVPEASCVHIFQRKWPANDFYPKTMRLLHVQRKCTGKWFPLKSVISSWKPITSCWEYVATNWMVRAAGIIAVSHWYYKGVTGYLWISDAVCTLTGNWILWMCSSHERWRIPPTCRLCKWAGRITSMGWTPIPSSTATTTSTFGGKFYEHPSKKSFPGVSPTGKPGGPYPGVNRDSLVYLLWGSSSTEG